MGAAFVAVTKFCVTVSGQSLAPPFLIQLPVNEHPGRQQMMMQAHGSLPPTWVV